MKKFFIALGAIFLLLIVLAAIGFAYVAVRGSALDKESKAYVDDAVPAIVSSWDVQALFNRASPELLKSMSPGEADRLFAAFRKLGKMQKYGGSKGQAFIGWDLNKGRTVTARYTAIASFNVDVVQIEISLIKHNDRWQIVGFFLKSLRAPQTPSRSTKINRLLPALLVS